MTDEQLLVAARSDPLAFEVFYRRRVGAVVRFAARRSSSSTEVVDLVSAIWLEVVASIARFDEERGSALGWVLGIGAHLCASEARRLAAEAAATQRLAGQRLLQGDDFERIETELDAGAVAKHLLAAIGDLPAAEREVAELTLVEGMSPSEAAQALGIVSSAARMRLARARRKLRGGAGLTHTDDAQEVVG